MVKGRMITETRSPPRGSETATAAPAGVALGGGDPVLGLQRAVADAYRDEWGQVVATVIGLTGDWDLAEDCAQDAFAAALATWSRDGIPPRPGAWLTTTARNKARDRLRHDATGRERTRRLAALAGAGEDEPPEHIPDERLRLIFTCCHPALPLAARVALTLRTLAGLTTGEIAAAATMMNEPVRRWRRSWPTRWPTGWSTCGPGATPVSTSTSSRRACRSSGASA
mgnify:CR=1 FL=1